MIFDSFKAIFDKKWFRMDKQIFQINYKWFRNHSLITYFQLQINFIPIFDFESRFMFLSGTIKLLLFSNLCKMYYLFSKVISSFQLNKKTLVGVSNLVFNETAKLSSYFHFFHMRHSLSYSIYWDWFIEISMILYWEAAYLFLWLLPIFLWTFVYVHLWLFKTIFNLTLILSYLDHCTAERPWTERNYLLNN